MWVDEYIKLMFPKNINDMKMEQAMQLKYQHTPSALYKYRGVSNYSIENLKNDEIWFNTANQLNDPYDCALIIDTTEHVKKKISSTLLQNIPDMIERFNLDVTEDEIRITVGTEFKEIAKYILSLDENLQGQLEGVEGFVNEVEKTIEQLGNEQLQKFNRRSQEGMLISCFSEVNNSILMWSHYANNHTGFCVEYNFKKPERDPVLIRTLQPVIYTDKLFDMSEYLSEAENDLSNYNNLISTYAAIIKSTEWSYEKEWRIAIPIGQGKGFSRPIFKPEAIYLGTRIADNYKEEIIEIAKQKQVPVFQMRMENYEFKLIPEKIL